MNRDAENYRIPWLRVNVMTPVHALKLPAMSFQDTTKSPTRQRFHTSISTT